MEAESGEMLSQCRRARHMINGGVVMMPGVRHCQSDERHRETGGQSGGCKVLVMMITLSRGVGSLGSL